MNPNQPITEERLRLILSRLHPDINDWEPVFAPAPTPPQVVVPPPPPTVTGDRLCGAEEIAQMRVWIGSKETGPWTDTETHAVRRMLGKES